MSRAIPPLPHYVFMALCLIKHRDFTFTYTYTYVEFLWFVSGNCLSTHSGPSRTFISEFSRIMPHDVDSSDDRSFRSWPRRGQYTAQSGGCMMSLQRDLWIFLVGSLNTILYANRVVCVCVCVWGNRTVFASVSSPIDGISSKKKVWPVTDAIIFVAFDLLASKWCGEVRTASSNTLTSLLGGIALGYVLNDRGFQSLQGLGIFLFITSSRPALWSTQPPIQWVTGALSLGIKRPGREADHSPPSSSEVKNSWNYTSTPPVYLNGVLLS
jgi:hypothetical protein